MSEGTADGAARQSAIPKTFALSIRASIPKAILAALLVHWTCLGLLIALTAPFGSGTDESMRYTAFAAAKNRWATEADFHRHGIEHFYYPPLYFLAFAPFWGDEPSFVEDYPQQDGGEVDPNYMNFAGRRVISTGFQSRVPAPLVRLYRQAKLFSLGCGLAVLLALIVTLRLLFRGPSGWWVVLLGATPLLLLPQFLYYHTLANNDSLLNALGALATCAFTAAILSLGRGSERRFVALSLAAAAFMGLAFLTKMSAPVLLPLAFGLVWARFRADRGLARRARTRRALLLLAVLAAVIFLSGGWWVGYKWLQGDWNSFEAHRLAHPWAQVNHESLAHPLWWFNRVIQIVRSYYALFSGALFISVPDVVFLAWFTLPLAVLGCAGAVAVAGSRGGKPTRTVGPESQLRSIVWGTFAGLLILNAGAILANLRFFTAAYGRLMFPSAVALHVAAAAIVARTLRGRPRALAAVTLALVAHTGLLFTWTFLHRMTAAVLQPPEDVRVLTGTDTGRGVGPVWDYSVEQVLRVPPGGLAAIRVGISRKNHIPQVGASLEGELRFRFANGREETVRVRRIALGDNVFSYIWAELELERTVWLSEETEAFLSLRGSPSAWFPEVSQFRYRCASHGVPARWNGTVEPCVLCVAAVYRVADGAGPPSGEGSAASRD